MNFLSITKITAWFAIVKLSITAGSLRILWPRNCRRPSPLSCLQTQAKSSLLLLRHQRTDFAHALSLSSILLLLMNQWSLKPAVKVFKVLSRNMSLIRVTKLKSRLLVLRWMFSCWATSTTLVSSAWRCSSTSQQAKRLSIWLSRRLPVSKSSSFLSRIWASILIVMSSLLSSVHSHKVKRRMSHSR